MGISLSPLALMKKYFMATFMVLFLFTGASMLISASPAFAEDPPYLGGSYQGETRGDVPHDANAGGGTFTTPRIPPSPSAPPPAAATPIYNGPNSSVDWYGPSSKQNWPPSGLCPVRDDGKKALTMVITVATRYYPTDGTPPPGSGWQHSYKTGNYGGANTVFTKVEQLSRQCLYPPRVYYASLQCSIAYYVDIYRHVPSVRVFGQSSGSTGYAEGSYNYNACANSYGIARVRSPITEYGFYSVRAWQRVANATVEIAYSPNEVTGVTPPPKIVGLSPAYFTGKRTLATASLDCRNGFRNPGLTTIGDWTENPCGTNSGSYTCSPQPVLFDAADGAGRSMRSFPGNNAQFPRDGKARELRFNQTVSGAQIVVQSQNTRFLRGANSTPWDSSALYNNNLFELADRKDGSSILSQDGGTKSGDYNGNRQTVWARGYAAGSQGQPTTITQRIDWRGLRNIRSADVTSVNPYTGSVGFTPVVRQVPTSGVCNQTATLDYIRAIGDAVR